MPATSREPVWPDGISVRTATATTTGGCTQRSSRCGRTPTTRYDETFEEWAHWHVERESYDPRLWFLAIAGGELAGFSICRQDSVDPTAGYVAMLGVRRPWRRQGLGEALLVHSFAEFRRRG